MEPTTAAASDGWRTGRNAASTFLSNVLLFVGFLLLLSQIPREQSSVNVPCQATLCFLGDAHPVPKQHSEHCKPHL